MHSVLFLLVSRYERVPSVITWHNQAYQDLDELLGLRRIAAVHINTVTHYHNPNMLL